MVDLMGSDDTGFASLHFFPAVPGPQWLQAAASRRDHEGSSTHRLECSSFWVVYDTPRPKKSPNQKEATLETLGGA